MPWYTSLSVTTAKMMVSRSMPLVSDNLHLDYLSMDLDGPFSDIIKGVYGVREDIHGDEPGAQYTISQFRDNYKLPVPYKSARRRNP